MLLSSLVLTTFFFISDFSSTSRHGSFCSGFFAAFAVITPGSGGGEGGDEGWESRGGSPEGRFSLFSRAYFLISSFLGLLAGSPPLSPLGSCLGLPVASPGPRGVRAGSGGVGGLGGGVGSLAGSFFSLFRAGFLIFLFSGVLASSSQFPLLACSAGRPVAAPGLGVGWAGSGGDGDLEGGGGEAGVLCLGGLGGKFWLSNSSDLELLSSFVCFSFLLNISLCLAPRYPCKLGRLVGGGSLGSLGSEFCLIGSGILTLSRYTFNFRVFSGLVGV